MQKSDLIPDAPLVTVNRAVDISDRGFVVDFAAFADGPSIISRVLDIERYLKPPIQLWCPRSATFHDNGVMNWLDMVSQWEPYLPASVGIRTTPFGIVHTPGKTSRYVFCLLATLERVLMFRPEVVRILCADMMGSWAPGLTEEECEMHQSKLEEVKRRIGEAQKRLTESKGKDKASEVVRDNLNVELQKLLKDGDPHKFERWKHERLHLQELEKRANIAGTKFEWKIPAVTA